MTREKVHIGEIKSHSAPKRRLGLTYVPEERLESKLQMVQEELGGELEEVPILDEHLVCSTSIPP